MVVGINYAPETTGIAPYTTDMCQHLAAQGMAVTALVGQPHYPYWRRMPDLDGAGEATAGVEVVRCDHYVPRTQTAARRGLYEATFRRSSRRAARPVLADLVIGVSPALAGLLTARDAARARDVPFVAVVQDLMGASAMQSGISGGRSVASFVRRTEIEVLRDADAVCVISRAFEQVLVDGGVDPHRIHFMPNFSHIARLLASRNDAREQLGWARDRAVALHTGNMGLKQDLGNIVAAAADAGRSRPDLDFVLMGDGSQRRELESQAQGLPNVRFLDPVASAAYPVALAAADVLLVNERSTIRDMSLPSKLTSYFAAGRPVVAAVPLDGATAREMAASEAGVTVPPADPGGLVLQIGRLLDDPDHRAELGRNGRAYAESTLSRAAAHERLDGLVRLLLGMPPEPAVSAVPVQRVPETTSTEALAGPGRQPSIV
jgi:glycosyltransferase involved in cell wall biosynthesis